MKALATITGPIHVVGEGPIFRAIFPMDIGNDPITAGLVGAKGYLLSKIVRPGDEVMVEGHFITEKTFGKIFVLEYMNLPEEASKGRNLNVVA